MEDLESYDSGLQKRTMGKFLTQLKKIVKFQDDKELIRFEDALTKRNFLMHHFFRERSQKLETEEG